VRRALLLASFASLAVTAVLAPSAAATWRPGGAGSATATALVIAAAPAPTATTAAGRTVTVTFPQLTVRGSSLGAVPGGGYLVRRVPAAGGTPVTPAGTCGVLVTGSASSLSCTEPAAPTGAWRYTVTATLHSWRAPAGQPGPQVTIGAPALALTSSSTVTTLLATLAGTFSGLADGVSLQFRLDSATGTVLTASPATVPAGGAGSFTVTVPAGPSAGSHSIIAVAGDGGQATVAITYAPAPRATTLAIANATGTSRRPDAGDTIAVTFSQAIQASSLCSTWTSDTTDYSQGGITVNLARVGTTANRMTVTGVTGACGGSLAFGTLTLPYGYAPAAGVNYTGSTAAWNASARRLTITLGTASANASTLTGSRTASLTPAAAIVSTYGTPIDIATPATLTGSLF
jgi:hypothetical protein